MTNSNVNNFIEKQDTFYLTLLRGLAAIIVITYHVGNGRNNNISDKMVRDCCTAIGNWAVPIFFMISGALFLGVKKYLDYNKHLKKTFHIAILTIVWAFIYNLISIIFIEKRICFSIIVKVFIMSIKGSSQYCFHLWYLYYLVGVYLLYPYLRVVFEQMSFKQGLFLLLLGGTYSWILPTLIKIFTNNDTLSSIWGGGLSYCNGFITYAILGYFLYEYQISMKVYIISVICAIMILIGYIYIGLAQNIKMYNIFINYNSMTTVILSSCIFIISKKVSFNQKKLIHKILMLIAKYSLCIYLIHVMIIQILRKIFNVGSDSFPLIISLPLITCVSLLICLQIGIIAKRIPFIKNYL